MINPNRTHRIKNALVIMINGHHVGRCEFKSKGTTFHGWIDKPKFELGDRVNLQVQFSITQDTYIVQTANKPKAPKKSAA